jgi:DNA polymerase III sliding clamp (beta) subunit (PCNA family)
MSTFHAYVDAAHFHEALGNVLRFAAKRSRLPILEEAQVRFEDGHCVLTCTNLDQWCMSTIPAVGDSFSFVFVGTRKILSACKYFSSLTRLNPQRQTLIRGAKFLSATGNGA